MFRQKSRASSEDEPVAEVAFFSGIDKTLFRIGIEESGQGFFEHFLDRHLAFQSGFSCGLTVLPCPAKADCNEFFFSTFLHAAKPITRTYCLFTDKSRHV